MTYLEGKDVELVRHDLAKDPPSRALLEKIIDAEHPEEFLNRRSPAYKERDLGSRKLTKKQVIDLMLEDVNLIRRPIVLRGGKVSFGYDEEAMDGVVSGR